MFKKIISIFVIFFCLVSCADTFDSVKRGLTGEKKQSAEEFLVKKKAPLVLPPDYENLPTPQEISETSEEISTFEKTLGASIEETSTSSSSTETSILKKIQSK
tara:strand:- start:3497 stop:3805 length:309 start_codon:yes stop_codon:yes gene_type:complete